jgi:phosphoribosylformimino-5-aminoimidazole carboxamide ribotide isomerase
MFRLIPAIDILNKQLVRLKQGDYNQATFYSQSPVEMAHHYQSMGFNYIHVVDLNGAKDGDLVNLGTIQRLAEIPDIQIQVGGGVRTLTHVDKLVQAGVSAVIIGSLFVQNFELACSIIEAYPNQIIAGLDVLNGKLATHGWVKDSNMPIEDMMNKLSKFPLHSIVSTDISKDGTFNGLNLGLYERISKISSHPIIASGGVCSVNDIRLLKQINHARINGCIVGKAIIEGRISQQDILELT